METSWREMNGKAGGNIPGLFSPSSGWFGLPAGDGKQGSLGFAGQEGDPEAGHWEPEELLTTQPHMQDFHP